MSGFATVRMLPAPYGGWDTREAPADMPIDRALLLDNWFPRGDRLETRGGWREWATGLGAEVHSLLPYAPPSGARRLWAVAGGSFVDVTAAGPAGTPALTGLSLAPWQHVQVGTAGGQFLLAVNGMDAPRLFNGTDWTVSAITGPVPERLVWANLHQRRVWLGERDSLQAWYLAPNAIMGPAEPFSFAAVCSLGGSLAGMATWTRDGGSGVDDLAVFVTTEGECLVYAGTDPASLATWGLQGVFRIGRPIGRRCFAKVGGDLLILTEDGVVPLSRVLPIDRAVQPRASVTNRIDRAFNAAVRETGRLPGWEMIVYPRGEMLLANVPQLAGEFHQFAFNIGSGAAARFLGQPARCWGLSEDRLFFGTADGRVCEADWGASDNGAPILADGAQAFTNLGSQGATKRLKRAEAILEANGVPTAALDVGTDLEIAAPVEPYADGVTQSPGAAWDVSQWDVAEWAPALVVWRGWRGVRGQGRTVSVRLRHRSATVRAAWSATQLMLVPGGPI